MDIACKNTIARIQKCATIMGKSESDQLKVSQLFYPCMQATDVFFLDVDICQLGIDQRKVNMLAIEYCGANRDKPIIVSHGMVSGLIEGQQKMSKSNPDSAIFM
jgi:tyrosyl-tRNA synthetase